MKKAGAQLLSTIIIAVAIIYAGYMFTSNTLEIKNTAPVQQLNGGATNTISVSEQGIVYATPDVLFVNITIEEKAQTTKSALDTTNQKVEQVRSILQRKGIKNENITSTNISINPKYNRIDGRQNFEGYTATHSLKVKILANNGAFEDAGSIIDQVAEVNNVRLNSLQYDIEDKEPYLEQAREKAFELAKNKAEQLANLGEVKIGKPISLSENSNISGEPQPVYRMAAEAVGIGGGGAGTDVQAGQMQIATNISVVFEIE